MKMPKLHKTLLTLLLVLTPPYFLMFTDDGMRVSDNFVLWLFGGKTLEFNLEEADGSFTRNQVLGVFKDLDWQCEDAPSAFGTHLCGAAIASFNSFPARYLTTFYANDRFNAIKIAYRPQYHEQVLGHLIKTLGQPANVAEALKDTPDAAEVLEWHTGKGVVVLRKTLREEDEAALIWLAGTTAH